MPRTRRTTPASLYSSCLEPTLHALSKISVPDVSEADTEWPLDHLPSEIVSDLMEAQIVRYIRIGDPVLIYAINYRILFTPLVKRATVFFKHEDLGLLALRCRRLKQLVIVTWNSSYKMDFFKPLLQVSSVLQVTVEKYQYGFIVYNAELRRSVLPSNVTFCCSPFAERILAHAPYSLLPKLRAAEPASERPVELYLLNVDVHVKDAMLILRLCPRIRILRCRNQLEALYLLHKDADLDETNIICTYELRNMDYVNCVLGEESDQSSVLRSEDDLLLAVKIAVRLCPKIRIILLRYDFDRIEQKFRVLEPLLDLTCIEGLYLMGGPGKERDLYMLLRKHGRTLLALELSVFQTLDLDLIVCLCPNVVYLELAIGDLTVQEPVVLPSSELHNLRSLKVGRVCNTGLAPGSWDVLLGSRMLTYIQLLDIEIHSHILDHVTSKNPWENLLELCLVRCHTVNLSHVMNLLKRDNQLRTLIVHLCKLIGEGEAFQIENYVSEKNLDIKVLINPFE